MHGERFGLLQRWPGAAAGRERTGTPRLAASLLAAAVAVSTVGPAFAAVPAATPSDGRGGQEVARGADEGSGPTSQDRKGHGRSDHGHEGNGHKGNGHKGGGKKGDGNGNGGNGGNGHGNKGRGQKTVTRTFASGAGITIPDVGAAAPYPSAIRVEGIKQGKIMDVNLTLRDFSHEFSNDVDVLLVAPDGRNAVVLGDVGGNGPDVENLTITLDDEAGATPPIESGSVLTSGTFRPLDNLGPTDTDDPSLLSFPAPAPAASGQSALSTFDGIAPNGDWRLFVMDDTEGDVGEIAGGWSLEITAQVKKRNR